MTWRFWVLRPSSRCSISSTSRLVPASALLFQSQLGSGAFWGETSHAHELHAGCDHGKQSAPIARQTSTLDELAQGHVHGGEERVKQQRAAEGAMPA